MVSRKLFVLLLVAMALATITIIVLSVTGHDPLIVAAMDWVSHFLSQTAVTLVVVLVLAAYALWALS